MKKFIIMIFFFVLPSVSFSIVVSNMHSGIKFNDFVRFLGQLNEIEKASPTKYFKITPGHNGFRVYFYDMIKGKSCNHFISIIGGYNDLKDGFPSSARVIIGSSDLRCEVYKVKRKPLFLKEIIAQLNNVIENSAVARGTKYSTFWLDSFVSIDDKISKMKLYAFDNVYMTSVPCDLELKNGKPQKCTDILEPKYKKK